MSYTTAEKNQLRQAYEDVAKAQLAQKKAEEAQALAIKERDMARAELDNALWLRKDVRWHSVYGAMVANKVSSHIDTTLRGVQRTEMNRFVFDAKDVADLAEESWEKVITKKP